MDAVGIISELNPFHNGHAHLIRTLREHGAETVLCAMSGNFTQRGEAALCSKWARAEMAMQGGADLVVELPFLYAVRNARDFARGGVQLLSALGCRQLAFGCETTDHALLSELTALLSEEPLPYKEELHRRLNAGQGFAAARSAALCACMPEKANRIAQLLHQPNTILALEYLQAITRYAPHITPIPVERIGAGYHDPVLQPFASATAIRQRLYAQPILSPEIQQAVPAATAAVLQREIHAGRCPFRLSVLDTMLLSTLRLKKAESLSPLLDMREGLENSLLKYADRCGTAEELVQAVSGKRYPKSRIRRLLLYALFAVTEGQVRSMEALPLPPYAHILAANEHGMRYLRQLAHTTPALPPLLFSGRELRRFLSTAPDAAVKQLQLDLQASRLYTLGYPEPSRRIGDEDFRYCGIRR